MAQRKKKQSHTGRNLLAVGAAAIGAYYLYGAKSAKRNRKQVKAWMLKAKAEALEQMEKLDSVDEEQYHKIVDRVENKYKRLKHVSDKELSQLSKELRAHWKEIAKEAKPKKSPSKR